MEKRNYPIERKQAPMWECPVCHKIMSSRGKPGHLEKHHGRGKPLKEHDPYPEIPRALLPKKRPLSRSDVRNLISNVMTIIFDSTRTPDIVQLRSSLFQCEYLIRELEINASCSLEEAWAKFPITRDELEIFKPKTI